MAMTGREEIDAEAGLDFAGPSESQSHVEHRHALEATVFRPGRDAADAGELVFELDSGELRIRSID